MGHALLGDPADMCPLPPEDAVNGVETDMPAEKLLLVATPTQCLLGFEGGNPSRRLRQRTRVPRGGVCMAHAFESAVRWVPSMD